MQANLHDTQGNLHNVFATRIDGQRSLRFFALDFFAISVAFFCACLWFFCGRCGHPRGCQRDSEP